MGSDVHAGALDTPSCDRCVLKAGRWLAVEHPAVVEPAAWTRDLCAAYVAAIDRMHVGEFAQRVRRSVTGSAFR